MATYPGMNLRGEVRESVSLDEDDLSDVEDEVFIRDGKRGYKYEDISVKKPLMAPRRKPIIKSSFTTRTRYNSACRHWCKPLCYALTALTVLIGLIVAVIVVISFFPLPLDKFRRWLASEANNTQQSLKLLPCNDLKVTNVWNVNFPKIISESPIRTVDVDGDGVQDVIFGFGTSDENLLPPDLFCPMYMGVSPPCQGGIVALNGYNGSVIWKYWLPNSVFTLLCAVDIDLDNVTDCLVTGRGGIFLMITMKNGSLIWQFSDKYKQPLLVIDIYSANFIPDQDGDGINDIVAAHTLQKERVRSGHLIIVSGKTGVELHRVATANDVETFFTPQVLPRGNNSVILFGTGSPTSPGNLSVINLKDLMSGNMTFQTIYRDSSKGILSAAVLADITGDTILDIIFAAFNSTVVAINGKSYQQIWNFTIPNSETLSVPVPGYFNSDNITDFLIKYQTGSNFPTYYYSQTFIIDGKTGKPIYKKPIIDSVGSQMGSISLGLEGFGFDLLTFWISNCKDHEAIQDAFKFVPGSNIHEKSRADICKLRVNSTFTAKLFALNQFEQPPGIEIYNSEFMKLIEYNQPKTPFEEAASYIRQHPEGFKSLPETDNSYETNSKTFANAKYYDGSSFRHKDNGQGLIKDFSKNPKPKIAQKFKPDYEPNEAWQSGIPQYDLETDYLDEADPGTMYNNNKLLINENNRDPRSKDAAGKVDDEEQTANKKKDLSGDKYGIYDYRNVQDARDRLMHDLETPPNEILRDTYFKKREMQLKKSKMEERDLESHPDKEKENDDIKEALEKEKSESYNQSMSLWDLESEKELEDMEDDSWRSKREANFSVEGVPRITSVGAIVQSLNTSTNSIDLLLITYWLPPKDNAQILLNKDFDCINEKLKQASISNGESFSYKKKSLEETFMKECLEERGVNYAPHNHNHNVDPIIKNTPYYNQITHLKMGQLTVYRLRLECICEAKKGEKCARFLDSKNQSWSSYLGSLGDGVFNTRN